MGGCHGMESREFRCYCGCLHRWPALDRDALRRALHLVGSGYRAGTYYDALIHAATPLTRIVCGCGRHHQRAPGGGYVARMDRAVGMPGCLGWSEALAAELERLYTSRRVVGTVP